MGWSNFTSKCYYRGENSNELEMLLEKNQFSRNFSKVFVTTSNFLFYFLNPGTSFLSVDFINLTFYSYTVFFK